MRRSARECRERIVAALGVRHQRRRVATSESAVLESRDLEEAKKRARFALYEALNAIGEALDEMQRSVRDIYDFQQGSSSIVRSVRGLRKGLEQTRRDTFAVVSDLEDIWGATDSIRNAIRDIKVPRF